ncbi:hypothetical protein HMPREF9418_0644 [Neisseria macacae ATCC 33926]|uniref:Uncharacterized protein n=1 Tax=Neisseria macacae ATCC 33926 TaxID=997348 RepID=A0AA36UKW4_9NEIS|nr:hypothetical protein HMPREF9418_0644 [Neisseria macacae ATCC 33926]
MVMTTVARINTNRSLFELKRSSEHFQTTFLFGVSFELIHYI